MKITMSLHSNLAFRNLQCRAFVCLIFLWWKFFLSEQDEIFYTNSAPYCCLAFPAHHASCSFLLQLFNKLLTKLKSAIKRPTTNFYSELFFTMGMSINITQKITYWFCWKILSVFNLFTIREYPEFWIIM